MHKPCLSFFILIFLLSPASVWCRDWYVAVDGSDRAAGTLDAPFAGLRKAANSAKPGDTIYLRGGTYRELTAIQDLAGTAEAPIVLRAYQDEQVLFSGTELLDLTWTEWQDGIFKAPVDQPLWQLFSHDVLLDPARWPDAGLKDGSVWDVHASTRSTDRQWDNKTQRPRGVTKSGIIVDRNHPNAKEGHNTETLADTGIDFTGAVAVLNIGHWLTWARPVLTHEAGSDRFTYDPKGTRMRKVLEYYFFGLQALDRENEWWYDAAAKTVYLKPPVGRKPTDMQLEGRVRDFNLLARNCAHLRVEGIDFFATSFGLSDCHHIRIEDCDLRFPSTPKYMLGALDWVKVGRGGPQDNVMTFVTNKGDGDFGNVISNCSFAFPNSPAIALFSPGLVMENCDLHDIEWDVNSSGGMGALPGGPNTTLRNCTIHTTGASEGVRLGPGSTIEGNRIYHTSLMQHDGSAINIGTASQPGTVARRNWVYRANRQGIRFDSTEGAYGSDACVMENVIFHVYGGTGGNKYKGDYQLFNKNIAYDCFVAIPNRFSDTGLHNQHSLVSNNLVDQLVEWHPSFRAEGITATLDRNVTGVGICRELLRDPDNFDFRPRPDAARLIDKGRLVTREELPGKVIRLPEQQFHGSAPDIGVYEHGAPDYWIPGRAFPEPSFPVPPSGAQKVRPDADLMWKPGRHAASHILYFNPGTESERKVPLSHNIFSPGSLEPGKTYAWRVDALEPDGSVRSGPIWTFMVGN